VARPEITTNTSSASTSVTVPGVICQIPRSTMSDAASTWLDVTGFPAMTDAGSGPSTVSSTSATRIANVIENLQVRKGPTQ
jgi:hypothetical protein